ncbi:energy transducer TonB [Flavobacterium sp.]|uniref:energy transducer TonB n=1 Tax=Flavobacterium sp. TaxID=239 RepID=UPI003751DCFD
MKKILLLAMVMLATQFIFAQAPLSVAKSLPISYEDAEVKPEFPGGYNEFMKFIGQNFNTPEVEGLAGTIKVSFVVEVSGKITEIKILNDLGSGTGEEAKRVVSKSPNWSPGEQGGKPVRVAFQLPIIIRGQ